MLTSGTSSLQARYKFKAIAIKAAAGVGAEGCCYSTLRSDYLCGYSRREPRFFTNPSDIIHCAAEAGSAASSDCSTHSLAVISTHLAPTLCKECSVLGTVPMYTYIQQKPVLAVETAWPKTCYRLCLHAESHCLERGSTQAVFSSRLQLIAGQGRTKSQEREGYHRRKHRGERCSNREDTGLLLQSPPVTFNGSQLSPRGGDMFTAHYLRGWSAAHV